ncbi:MAG TPA: hypothetical protein H9857_11060 [Candidatus Desulfovibrio intestinigallinarum]|nr:hypothetical protein [Candidatus Desulfovibrio intestinigallinarum]
MEKTQFFHSLLAGLHRAAASRFTFFKVETPRVTKNNQNVENTSRRFRALHAALEHFQFEMLCISNHTACRFAEKARFFRSLWAGRRCAAASRFTFFKVETL